MFFIIIPYYLDCQMPKQKNLLVNFVHFTLFTQLFSPESYTSCLFLRSSSARYREIWVRTPLPLLIKKKKRSIITVIVQNPIF